MNKKTLPPQAYTRDTIVEAFNWLQNQDEKVRSSVHSTDALVSLYLRTKRFGNALESEAPVSSKDFKSNLKNLARGLQEFEEQSPVPTDLQNSAESDPAASSSKNVQPISSGLEAHMQQVSQQKQIQDQPPSQTASSQMDQLSPELLKKLDEIRSEMRSYVEPRLAESHEPRLAEHHDPRLADNHRLQVPPTQQAPQQTMSPTQFAPTIPAPMASQNSPAQSFSMDAQSWNYILRVQGQLNLTSPEEALKVVIATGARKLLKFLEIRD